MVLQQRRWDVGARCTLQAAGDDLCLRRSSGEHPDLAGTQQIAATRRSRPRSVDVVRRSTAARPRSSTSRARRAPCDRPRRLPGSFMPRCPLTPNPKHGEIESTPIDPLVDRRALGVEVVRIHVDRPVVGRFHDDRRALVGARRRSVPVRSPGVHRTRRAGAPMRRRTPPGDASVARRRERRRAGGEADAQGRSCRQSLEQGRRRRESNPSDAATRETSTCGRAQSQMTRSTNSPVDGSLRISLRRPSGRCSSLMIVSSPSFRAVRVIRFVPPWRQSSSIGSHWRLRLER